MTAIAGTTALVTGASRGIGREVALMLARRGADVVVNYRSKGPRAAAVAEAIRELGRRAVLAQADLTDRDDLARMVETIRAATPGLASLVLNASGGMEKDRPGDYAMQLNRDAQLATLEHALPLMAPGSTVVFVTSHWAHFYGRRPVVAGYESVAASKRAGEDALRDAIPRLAERGVRLVVVSGDAIEGTITPRLLERSQPGLLEFRRAQVGPLPTVADFAAAIVESIADESLASGDVVFVGATE